MNKSQTSINSKLAARLAAKGINLKKNIVHSGIHPIEENNKPAISDDQSITEASIAESITEKEPLSKEEIINQQLQTRSSAAQPKPTLQIPMSKEESKLSDEFNQKLPQGWEKHFSKDHDTWYYWDLLTDRVAWLPPDHEFHEPQLTRSEKDFNSVNKNLTGVTLPGNKVTQNKNSNKTAESVKMSHQQPNTNKPFKPPHQSNEVKKSQTQTRNPYPGSKRTFTPSFTNQGYGQKVDKGNSDEQNLSFKDQRNDKNKRQKKDRARGEDDFDPMDPSSYSDAPKGSWSRGMKSEKVKDIW